MERKTFLKILGLTPFAGNMNSFNDLNKISDSFSKSEKMPALFLGHGSPMNAIEENEFVNEFRNIAKITAMEMPRTIHDFGGFPKALFDVQYPAKGSPELAKETQKLLQPTTVELDDKWGLDHGAWSVIKHLYPEANIPVIQLSIDYSKPASYHYELAGQLQSLRDKGVLIIGSGNIIHNLRLIDFHNLNKVDYGHDWAIESHQKLNQLLLNGEYQSLVNYQGLNSAIQLAIPTPDHFLPLIYTLGLQQKGESLSLFNDKLIGGSISMTSLKIS